MSKRRSVSPQRRRRRWLIPKVLLVLACAVLVFFIGMIVLMERELRRVGLFGGDDAPASTSSPSARSPTTAEELTPDEKRQLDQILRSSPRGQ